MGVKHSKSQPTDDKPSMKWAWSRLGCTRDDIFSHFDKTSTCDRRADGHRAIAYTALAKRRAGTSRKQCVLRPSQTWRTAFLTLAAGDTWRTNASSGDRITRSTITTRANAVASFSVGALLQTSRATKTLLRFSSTAKPTRLFSNQKIAKIIGDSFRYAALFQTAHVKSCRGSYEPHCNRV